MVKPRDCDSLFDRVRVSALAQINIVSAGCFPARGDGEVRFLCANMQYLHDMALIRFDS